MASARASSIDSVDRGTLRRVWLPLVVASVALGFFFVSPIGPRDGLRWVGLGLAVAGLSGVMFSRLTLGRSFSIVPKATELVTRGPYSRIRNPIYVSGLLSILGICVMVRRPLFWFLPVVVVPLQIVRARREARVLEEKFGDAYRDYRERTWF